MPYVPQTRHVDRVRGAIEGRLPAPADSQRLVSSWQRSFEQYRLDPGSVIGPRVLTSAELREVQGKEEAFLIATACSAPPRGRQRWPLQLLAERIVAVGLVDAISDETIRRTLKKTTPSPG